MSIKKRRFERNNKKGFYFNGNKIVLESLKSKMVFFGILFLFGFVIALREWMFLLDDEEKR